MVEAADISDRDVIVELGAGTGPFTREINKQHPDAPFVALEPDTTLAQVLREQLPGLRVEERYAQDLPEILQSWGHDHVDRVISGLPWTVWSDEVQESILDAVCDSLADDGRLVTFTYVHAQVLPGAKRLKEKLSRRFRAVTRSRVAWANLPPAFVWVCSEPNRDNSAASP